MTIVSDLPNSTNFVRSLAGIRHEEPGQRSIEYRGVRESPTARATAPQLPLLSGGWSAEPEMTARMKRAKKVVLFQLKLDKPDGHTGGLPENRGWNDRHLSLLDLVVPEEGLEPSRG
jgi:hypothetical protein